MVQHEGALDDRRSLSEQIAIWLRDAIRSGELEDGSELNQIALADQFGVSRVPVREAMRQLQAEGWIDAKRHQRAVVRGISRERILEILELRALIETFLIEKTIVTITDAEVKRLTGLCDEMDATADHRHWLELNQTFHSALYASANSVTATKLLEQLSAQVERYVRSHGEHIRREGEADAEHRAILAAVRRRDVAESQRLVQLHIGHTTQRFRESSAHL
ncbi:MAG TPA: GntR family transcriptional regulator [Candidatus Lustribacter sp.]